MSTRFSLTSARRLGAAILGVLLLSTALSGCFGVYRGTPKPVAAIANLRGVNTGIRLDSGFTRALTSLGLKPGVAGGAHLRTKSGTVLVFPITGGNLTVFTPGEASPYVIGQIQHQGSGLTLTAGGTTVLLSNFNIDPGVSRVYGDVAVNDKTVVSSAFLFQLDGRTLKKLRRNGNRAILTGSKVEVSPVAAQLLNSTFHTSAVKAGLLVGVATVRVKPVRK